MLAQHTEETTMPSGLVIARHIGLTSIGIQKAPQVGEFLIATEVPEIDASGFLNNATDSFETPTMEEAVEPLATRVLKLGNVASLDIMPFAPDRNPELINETDEELIRKFKAILSLELGKRSVKKPSEDSSIGNYL